MEKNTGSLAIVLVILCLLLGGVTGYISAAGKEVEVIKEVEVETIVEVPVEVCGELCTTEIISTDTKPLLDTAIADFLEEVDDDKDLQYCDGERYDEDQIKVRAIDDEYSINYDDDGYEIVFEVELKYLDKDVEEKGYVDYEVTAYYETDEDVDIEYSIL